MSVAPPPPQPADEYPELPPGRDSHLSNLLAVQFNESQLIWNRFNVMLTANTVLAAVLAVFFTQAPEKHEWNGVVSGALFGFVLCGLWFALTFFGWRFSTSVVRRIADVAGVRRNPLIDFEVLYPKRDPIHLIAHVVIVIFAAAYIAIAAYGSIRAHDQQPSTASQAQAAPKTAVDSHL